MLVSPARHMGRLTHPPNRVDGTRPGRQDEAGRKRRPLPEHTASAALALTVILRERPPGTGTCTVAAARPKNLVAPRPAPSPARGPGTQRAGEILHSGNQILRPAPQVAARDGPVRRRPQNDSRGRENGSGTTNRVGGTRPGCHSEGAPSRYPNVHGGRGATEESGRAAPGTLPCTSRGTQRAGEILHSGNQILRPAPQIATRDGSVRRRPQNDSRGRREERPFGRARSASAGWQPGGKTAEAQGQSLCASASLPRSSVRPWRRRGEGGRWRTGTRPRPAAW